MKSRTILIAFLSLTGIIFLACCSISQKADFDGQLIDKKEFYIRYSKWPVWRDVPVQTQDSERIWRTIVDLLSEEFPLDVLDKESAYIRTAYVTIHNIGDRALRRLTVKMYPPEEGRVRVGLHVRLAGQESMIPIWVAWKIGPEKLWGDKPREIQDRLRQIR